MTTFEEQMQQELEELQHDPYFLTEGVLLAINETICTLMDSQGVTHAELAQRLGWRPAQVTRMLRGVHGMSIGRLMRVAVALECKITAPEFVPLPGPNPNGG